MHKLFLLGIFICTILGCNLNSGILSNSEITDLEEKYGKETIRYYHEVAYFNDVLKRPTGISFRWESNVQIYVDPSANQVVHNLIGPAISEINNIGLPISISRVQERSEGNLLIKEMDYDNSSSDQSQGPTAQFTSINEKDGETIHATIQLNLRMMKGFSDEKIKRILLEELIQSLGLQGDSYTYPNSLFFQLHYNQNELSQLDKNILRFHYDERLTTGYRRHQFELDFESVLGKTSVDEVETRDAGYQRQFERLKRYSYLNGKFYQVPKEIFININGDYNQGDIEVLSKYISAINNAAIGLSAHLINDGTNKVPLMNFNVEYKPSRSGDYTNIFSESTIGKNVMNPKIIGIDNSIIFNHSRISRNLRDATILVGFLRSCGLYNFSFADLKEQSSQDNKLCDRITNDLMETLRFVNSIKLE
jgi:hypothetical protein